MEKSLLHEARVHGDPMFQLGVYEVSELNNQVIFDCHWHYELEFVYLEKGEASFQIGTTLHQLKAGEAVFVPSGGLHAAYPLNNSEFRLYAIVFDSNFLSSFSYDAIQHKYLDLLNTESPFPIISQTNSWEKNIIHYLQKIISLFQTRDIAYELEIKADLLLIFSLFIKHHSTKLVAFRDPIEQEKIARLKQVLQFIQDNYPHKLTIYELATLVRMSEGHFSRFFKSLVHKTPIGYINSIRINHATRLLKETDRKIVDIAMDVGFENQSYFIKTFKKQKKCTPNSFRKMNLQ
ncbi:helix-turn-helix transcriptional regulator [Bacillus solitudinis]|uniref:helix-turn-helix transcriptional regulator n=1 Tax=Bacillus solitudinis TaxID=2014074 RepID=UPI000C24173E|nr:helix-turn-helix domain-containing protein [Bacillus solitudinis]